MEKGNGERIEKGKRGERRSEEMEIDERWLTGVRNCVREGD